MGADDGVVVRFCIHNTPRAARALLESLEPAAEGRDCFGRCAACFERAFLVLERAAGAGEEGTPVELRWEIVEAESSAQTHEDLLRRIGRIA